MKGMKWIVAGVMVALAGMAQAQTAQPVLPGALTTSGCPSVNQTPCYKPYSSDDPLPVTTALPEGAARDPYVDTTSPTYTAGTSNPPSMTTKGGVRIVGCDTTGACIADITAPSVITSGKTIKTVSGTLTSDTDVIAAVSSKRIKVIGYSLQNVGTNADICIFKSNGTGGTELWRMVLQGASGVPYGANMVTPAPSWIFATVAGEKLTLDVNQSDTIHYSISYYDDDAL